MAKQNSIQRFWSFIIRENLHRIFLIIFTMVFLGAIGLSLLEPGVSFVNALWWTIVTLTTVGYGDIAPATIGGRIIGIFIMFFGIGILGMFTATVAGVFVEKKLKEEKGMTSFKLKDHIIVCEWNFRSREIINELRSDPRTAECGIALISDIEEKPLDDPKLFFVKGAVTEENLKRANIELARTVVILGDDRLDDNARDAKVVLSTLTVESIRGEVYTIAELVDGNNVRHCERANADEIIVSSEFSSKLISRATMDHGISKVISELLSSQFGNDLYKIPAAAQHVGKEFIEVFTEMKKNSKSTVLAIQHGKDGKVVSNPEMDMIVKADDYLIIISNEKPE